MGVPLSYGTLYGLYGPVDLRTMPLALLIYLYSHDEPQKLESVLMAMHDEDIRRDLTGFLTIGVLGEDAVISQEDSYEWARRYLFKEMYGEGSGENTNRFREGFVEALRSRPMDYSLKALSRLCGEDLTAETLLEKIECSSARLKGYFRQFFQAHPELVTPFAVFTTGSTSPTVIRVRFTSRPDNLPRAHTCYNELEIYDYTRLMRVLKQSWHWRWNMRRALVTYNIRGAAPYDPLCQCKRRCPL